MVLLLERALVSWSLAMDERGGHKDLRVSGRRSVISYERTELYCSRMYEHEPFLFFDPVKWRMSEPFIAQGRVITLRPGTQQVVPRWLKPYTASRVLMTRSSK
jgi:hypothetical protein